MARLPLVPFMGARISGSSRRLVEDLGCSSKRVEGISSCSSHLHRDNTSNCLANLHSSCATIARDASNSLAGLHSSNANSYTTRTSNPKPSSYSNALTHRCFSLLSLAASKPRDAASLGCLNYRRCFFGALSLRLCETPSNVCVWQYVGSFMAGRGRKSLAFRRLREGAHILSFNSLLDLQKCLFSAKTSPNQPSPSGGQNAYWAKTSHPVYDPQVIQEWKDEFAVLSSYDSEDLLQWRAAFDFIDRDYDGFISQADLQKDPSFSLDKLRLLKAYDADQNNLIDFGEFVSAMQNVDTKTLRESFEGFDPVDVQLEFDKYATCGSGSDERTMKIEQVELIMKAQNFTCVTRRDAMRLFVDMDRNKDGLIDFEDFKLWLYHPS